MVVEANMEGIERIKILASEIKDEALLEIVNYLISREDMNDKYLNEEKSLRQMIDFIMNEAKKKAKDNRAIVKDEVVFGWAIHYWDESNEELKLGKATESNIEKVTESMKIKKSKIKSKDWKPEGQLTLFDLM
jgi:hypothetical protein